MPLSTRQKDVVWEMDILHVTRRRHINYKLLLIRTFDAIAGLEVWGEGGGGWYKKQFQFWHLVHFRRTLSEIWTWFRNRDA